jgi:hypothetical protein
VSQSQGGGSASATSTAGASTRSPTSTTTAGPGSATSHGVAAGSVERAILRQTRAPRPTAAACRSPTAAERSSTPFGRTGVALFSCRITVRGLTAQFYVQILANGCFVAERRGAGQAVYGCGVKRMSG